VCPTHRLLIVSSIVVAAIVTSTPIAADVEEARLPLVRAQNPGVADRYNDLARRLDQEMSAALDSASDLERCVTEAARSLWRRAVADVASGLADDRPLYWGRLAMRDAVTRNAPAQSHTSLLSIVERQSRGLADVRFPSDSRLRILVTGFDPFHLDQNIAQSNPSGLAALTLDGTELGEGSTTAQVQTAVIPVRFEDFDKGLIEDFLIERYRSDNLSMVVTISMGRDQFDLERFPGRRRSADSPDNRNVQSGGSSSRPLVPMSGFEKLNGPEFVEFSLPVAAMISAEGNWRIRDNRNIETLERGSFDASSLADLSGATAVRGSGGGYLSNEISYRSIVLRNDLGYTFPIGHIHTPSVPGYDKDMELQIIEQIRRMLERAVGTL
jgi:pyrrolidone-carboxylate peptidase